MNDLPTRARGDREPSASRDKIALWAGIECTVNRVGNVYHDQLERSGHDVRDDDLDRLAAIGITTLRYPILWERTAPYGLGRADWSWADRRLSRMRRLGIRPIVGLLHHGSGPVGTHLLSGDFPSQLAEFAGAVARRYPWVDAYTPVNEPLTTARFSGLYGHWYPHGRSDTKFVRALMNQCIGTARAMQAIRAEVPGARLVQTEDIGTVFSTPLLEYQANFENDRRFLSIDLLCGRVDEHHPLWAYLKRSGATDGELTLLARAPCAPEMVGINYYVTSDRFLDERVERYAPHKHGGNGRHAYADVEAVGVRRDGIAGHRKTIAAVWKRFGLPIALTEVHLGGGREDQLRWVNEAWCGAHAARAEGADVRAVTLWAAFGSFDWNSLVVHRGGHYESGIFDVRAPSPRSTALAGLARDLVTQGTASHPVAHGPGWWRRPARLVYPPYGDASPSMPLAMAILGRARPIVITGATGTLGRAFVRICGERGINAHAVRRADLDIADPASAARALEALDPWAVVNAAGYVRVDDAERDEHRCYRENTAGAEVLAKVCRDRGAQLLTFSSALVFDGARAHPYVESDQVGPLGVYGRTKAEAERRVLGILPRALVVRTSAFFDPWSEHDFISRALRTLASGQRLRAAGSVVSPTYLPDLVGACIDLLIDEEAGVWHLANEAAVSFAEFARAAAEVARIPKITIEVCANHDLGHHALRPTYSALGTERGRLLPPLRSALERYVRAARAPSWSGGS